MSSLGDRVLAHLRGVAGGADPPPRSEDETDVGFSPALGAIAGRFEIGERLGEGGMGTVYRAWDRAARRAVALKILRHGERALEERFDREIRALAALDHPGIVGYVAHGGAGSGDPPFVAMELLDGEDLGARLARGPLEVRETIHLGAELAGALAAAHAFGLVHRDVKPTNVILCRDGRARLVDFGLARLVEDDAPLTREGYAAGTPGYMAPEQARGEPDVDARADVFALGCVLHECLTGAPPPRHASGRLDARQPLRRARPEAPEALEAILAEMTATSRGARLGDGGAVAARLGALDRLVDLDVLGPRPTPATRRLEAFDAASAHADARAWISERLASPALRCLVVGAAGSGKTELARDLVGAAWTLVAADPLRADEPLGLLARLVAAVCGAAPSDGAAERRRSVEAKVREATADARVAAALCRLVSEPAAGRRPEAADAFLRWTERAWSREPWSVVLDDLDAADAESVAALADALARPAVARPRVLALARPTISVRHPGAAARLGLVTVSIGGATGGRSEAELAARLDVLGPYARWTLAGASLFSGAFSEAEITALLGQRDPGATRRALLELALFGWIVPAGATAAFEIRGRSEAEAARALLRPSEVTSGRRRADAIREL